MIIKIDTVIECTDCLFYAMLCFFWYSAVHNSRSMLCYAMYDFCTQLEETGSRSEI